MVVVVDRERVAERLGEGRRLGVVPDLREQLHGDLVVGRPNEPVRHGRRDEERGDGAPDRERVRDARPLEEREQEEKADPEPDRRRQLEPREGREQQDPRNAPRISKE